MLLNRYNYEEHFLLYADGELSPLEVEIVEQFVQVHPDLKEELDMLMDCKLIADMPVFFPKEKLYKQTVWDEENITQTQSQLLLLLDNELLASDKKTLEQNIAENPVLAQEWNTLQQSKLLAETIAHPHKEPLYKQKRIPTIMWWRWAAAAAVILGAGWFVVGKNSIIVKNGTVAIAKISAVDPIKNTASAVVPKQENASVPVDPNAETEQPETAQTDGTEEQENTVAATKNEPVITVKKAVINNAVTKENPEEEEEENVNTLAQNDNNPDNNDERQTLVRNKSIISVDDASNVKPQKAPAKFIGSTKTNLVVKNKTSQTDNIAGLQADADDNEYVHIAGARVKKQKLRGMFRNITRGIGRTFSNSKVEAATPMAINN